MLFCNFFIRQNLIQTISDPVYFAEKLCPVDLFGLDMDSRSLVSECPAPAVSNMTEIYFRTSAVNTYQPVNCV